MKIGNGVRGHRVGLVSITESSMGTGGDILGQDETSRMILMGFVSIACTAINQRRLVQPLFRPNTLAPRIHSEDEQNKRQNGCKEP
jgi:hypothetical protein